MTPKCWYCPDEPPLMLMVAAHEETWDHRPVVVLVWTCPICQNGRILRADPEAQMALPGLEP